MTLSNCIFIWNKGKGYIQSLSGTKGEKRWHFEKKEINFGKRCDILTSINVCSLEMEIINPTLTYILDTQSTSVFIFWKYKETISWIFHKRQCLIIYFLKIVFAYSWETHRERQKNRWREKQDPCGKADAGLNPRTPVS